MIRRSFAAAIGFTVLALGGCIQLPAPPSSRPILPASNYVWPAEPRPVMPYYDYPAPQASLRQTNRRPVGDDLAGRNEPAPVQSPIPPSAEVEPPRVRSPVTAPDERCGWWEFCPWQ
jgi:hypothetical protein